MTKLMSLLFIVAVSTHAYDETRKSSLSAAGIQSIFIEAEAGFLEIRQGGDEIRVEARIVVEGSSDAEDEEFVRNHLKLSLTREGDRAVIVSGFKDESSWFQRRSKRIDLKVWVPKGRMIRVEDGSGSISISGLQNDLRISDGSGDIDIEEIGGNIAIEDGSGSIHIRNVNGNVSIDDGSGEISVRSIEGSVEVSDGSGSIRLADIKRDVVIHDDGSGSVSISNVQGTVTRKDKHRNWHDD